MKESKDTCGLPIAKGFYQDEIGNHYYHIKETPEGLMKKGSNEKYYSSLDSFLATHLRRISNQKELVNLILSIETKFDEELEEEVHTGVLGKSSSSQSQP